MHRMEIRPRDRVLPSLLSSKCLPKSTGAPPAASSSGAAGTNPLSLFSFGTEEGTDDGAALTSSPAAAAAADADCVPGTGIPVSASSCNAFASASFLIRSSSASRSARVFGMACLITPNGKGCFTKSGSSSSSSEDSNSGISLSRRFTTSTSGAFFTRRSGGSEVGAGGTNFFCLRSAYDSGSSSGGARPPPIPRGGARTGAGAFVADSGLSRGGKGCPSGMPGGLDRGGSGRGARLICAPAPAGAAPGGLPPGGPPGGPRGGGRPGGPRGPVNFGAALATGGSIGSSNIAMAPCFFPAEGTGGCLAGATSREGGFAVSDGGRFGAFTFGRCDAWLNSIGGGARGGGFAAVGKPAGGAPGGRFRGGAPGGPRPGGPPGGGPPGGPLGGGAPGGRRGGLLILYTDGCSKLQFYFILFNDSFVVM
mmetsp:Transcript_12702/g.21262  ORF Transcript_12702/g.21262 Transcript_12702/m.21262 type:complete len:423 (+) Transcript_12702:2567-3835(+)